MSYVPVIKISSYSNSICRLCVRVFGGSWWWYPINVVSANACSYGSNEYSTLLKSGKRPVSDTWEASTTTKYWYGIILAHSRLVLRIGNARWKELKGRSVIPPWNWFRHYCGKYCTFWHIDGREKVCLALVVLVGILEYPSRIHHQTVGRLIEHR